MTDGERQEWKEANRQRIEGFARNEIAICERIYGPVSETTRPDRLEDIRRRVRESARVHWLIMDDRVSEECLVLSLELFDEVLNDVKRTAAN